MLGSSSEAEDAVQEMPAAAADGELEPSKRVDQREICPPGTDVAQDHLRAVDDDHHRRRYVARAGHGPPRRRCRNRDAMCASNSSA